MTFPETVGGIPPETSPEVSAIGRMVAGGLSDGGAWKYKQPEGGNEAAALCFYGPPWFYPSREVPGIAGTPDARQLAASTNHREAEKRRRQRINTHLDKLRSLLPCNSKMDKASLLGKVVQRVRELEREAAGITRLETAPSEADEVTVALSACDLRTETPATIRASLCCDDRSDLIPDIIRTLKALRLRTLRAEMATLCGRVRNVLVVAGDGGSDRRAAELSVQFLRNALRSVVEQSGDAGAGRWKRQRF